VQRCLDVNGADNPDVLDAWTCDNPPGADKNLEWAWDAATGALTSLDTLPCCAGMCVTPQE
jgi:hypothetical protein